MHALSIAGILHPSKIFSPLLEALCIKYFRNVPKKPFSISHCCGSLLLLWLFPRGVHKGLHGCLGLSRIRDQDWAPGSPWVVERGPRGGLVSSETQRPLSLPWTSLLFTAASHPGQTLFKICVIPFSHPSLLAAHLNSSPCLLPQICTLFPRREEKKLIWPLCWGKQNSIFSCGAEKSFFLTLKLKVIDLNVE